jgi:hypothetical protein
MDEKILYQHQIEQVRQRRNEHFVDFLHIYSDLLKSAREYGFDGEDSYRVVEAFLQMDSTE